MLDIPAAYWYHHILPHQYIEVNMKKRKKKSTMPTDGTDKPKPVSRNGPELYLRTRSLFQRSKIAAAARRAGMSTNTWCIEILDRAASGSVTITPN